MGKSYKQVKAFQDMNKRGQVAIFVIVAIAIVGIIILLFVFPKISSTTTGSEDPNSFMKKCIQPELARVLGIIAKQGGYYTPTHYLTYEDEKIQYLCYISGNYKPCIVQQPLLVSHVEGELKSLIKPKATECISSLKQEYERKGYTVSALPTDVDISIIPESVRVNLNSPIVVSKAGTEAYKTFSTSIDSDLYYLLTTATSIINYESTYGDSEITLYLQFYPDLKIEKIKRDSDTIYRITNVISKDKFTFATRSLVWPQGYGLGAGK
jgi:hypothetical protein